MQDANDVTFSKTRNRENAKSRMPAYMSVPGAALRAAEQAILNHQGGSLLRAKSVGTLDILSKPKLVRVEGSIDAWPGTALHYSRPRKRGKTPRTNMTIAPPFADDNFPVAARGPPDPFHMVLHRSLSQSSLASLTPVQNATSPFAWGDNGADGFISTHRTHYMEHGPARRVPTPKPKPSQVPWETAGQQQLGRSTSHETFIMHGRINYTVPCLPHVSGPTPPWHDERKDRSFSVHGTTSKTTFHEHPFSMREPYRPRTTSASMLGNVPPSEVQSTSHAAFLVHPVRRTLATLPVKNPSPFLSDSQDPLPESTARAAYPEHAFSRPREPYRPRAFSEII